MVVVPLDAWAFIKFYEGRVKEGIRKALPVLLEELKRLTPEDTKEMLNSYEVKEPIVRNWEVVWSIENHAEHAIYVEFWVAWVRFWYHKPKWSLFYVGVGNRTFTRAVDNKRSEIIQIITNEISKW